MIKLLLIKLKIDLINDISNTLDIQYYILKMSVINIEDVNGNFIGSIPIDLMIKHSKIVNKIFKYAEKNSNNDNITIQFQQSEESIKLFLGVGDVYSLSDVFGMIEILDFFDADFELKSVCIQKLSIQTIYDLSVEYKRKSNDKIRILDILMENILGNTNIINYFYKIPITINRLLEDNLYTKTVNLFLCETISLYYRLRTSSKLSNRLIFRNWILDELNLRIEKLKHSEQKLHTDGILYMITRDNSHIPFRGGYDDLVTFDIVKKLNI